jgi:hypothetical protein
VEAERTASRSGRRRQGHARGLGHRRQHLGRGLEGREGRRRLELGLSFRYDLWSVRTVERETLHIDEQFAVAPPTAVSPYGGARRARARPWSPSWATTRSAGPPVTPRTSTRAWPRTPTRPRSTRRTPTTDASATWPSLRLAARGQRADGAVVEPRRRRRVAVAVAAAVPPPSASKPKDSAKAAQGRQARAGAGPARVPAGPGVRGRSQGRVSLAPELIKQQAQPGHRGLRRSQRARQRAARDRPRQHRQDAAHRRRRAAGADPRRQPRRDARPARRRAHGDRGADRRDGRRPPAASRPRAPRRRWARATSSRRRR